VTGDCVQRLAPRQDRSTSIDVRVRYAETDQMGVVYHANYLIWCEIARTELIRRRLVSYAELEKQGVFLAVTDASIRYNAPARYDDLVRVATWLTEVRSRTVVFAYQIDRVNEKTGDTNRLASATTTLVVLGPDSRPRKMPSSLVQALMDDLDG
jgi:acyl-CoA thioester hydrolase